MPIMELQSWYVQEFDLSRRHALHLTYWTDGDTRRRGEVLAAIKQTYRDSGLLVDLAGELPDYLPMVLEFAAVGAPASGVALLNTYRASLELLRIGLAEDKLPQAGVVAAVCDSARRALAADPGRGPRPAWAARPPRPSAYDHPPVPAPYAATARSTDDEHSALGRPALRGAADPRGRPDLALPLRPVRLDDAVVSAVRVQAAEDRLAACSTSR